MSKLPLILGSQSARRKEILSFFSIPFKQVPSDFDENSIPFNGNPLEYVKVLSDSKAMALASLYPDNLLLTADTIVYKDGKSYGKPANEEELFRFLRELEGQWHSVFTSLTLRDGQHAFQQTEETRVLFNPISESQMKFYCNYLPWQDKAGGYMIQAAGGVIVKRIEGCYYNVMGLPINSLRELLTKAGIDLWNYLK
jgi:septum formation protein